MKNSEKTMSRLATLVAVFIIIIGYSYKTFILSDRFITDHFSSGYYRIFSDLWYGNIHLVVFVITAFISAHYFGKRAGMRISKTPSKYFRYGVAAVLSIIICSQLMDWLSQSLIHIIIYREFSNTDLYFIYEWFLVMTFNTILFFIPGIFLGFLFGSKIKKALKV